jgi:hypothetical protein
VSNVATGKDSGASAGGAATAAGSTKDSKKGHYVGIHASGFKDFLLKPELLRSIVDAGFEHPSEVQHESIPQAVLGGDIVCQAKSGMGKTAGKRKRKRINGISIDYRCTSFLFSRKRVICILFSLTLLK